MEVAVLLVTTSLTSYYGTKDNQQNRDDICETEYSKGSEVTYTISTQRIEPTELCLGVSKREKTAICSCRYNERDLTDAILIAQKQLAAEESPDRLAEITDTHVAQTINDIFIAGIDTSRQTLYWTILYIAAHPDVQAKIHQEVDSVLGSRITPMASDRASLPYTEAVLYESMRIATVAPLSLPHSTTCDTSIGDYTLPKDTLVLPNMHAIHHDAKLWADPWKFKPERFLDSNGRVMRKESWMPFSIGKRACMAEALAKPHLHMVLVAFYRNFEIRMPEGVTADLKPVETGIVYLAKNYKVVIKDKLA